MDIVYIKELEIETVIGIFEWERNIKQVVSIDLEMACDVKHAAESDRIEDAVNYKSIAKRLIEFVEASEFQLIETLAERIADIVRTEFGVRWLRLRLGKPGAVSGSRDVGLVIERGEKTRE